MAEGSSNPVRTDAPDTKSARVLARAILKDLQGQGYAPEHVLALTTELLGLVADDLRARGDRRRGA